MANKYEVLPKDLFEKYIYKHSKDILKNPLFENKDCGGKTMSEVNHCIVGGGMSICAATRIKSSQEKLQSQNECTFFVKAQFETRCMWEVYGEYCWCIEAQSNAKG